jgi:hypothetical protein
MNAFVRDLNRILERSRSGLQFCDLADEDQQELLQMADNGFTAKQVLDVMDEVSDVE